MWLYNRFRVYNVGDNWFLFDSVWGSSTRVWSIVVEVWVGEVVS